MIRPSSLVVLLLALASAAVPADAEEAFPDRIVALGDTLRGRVSRFTGGDVELTMRYGTGSIRVPFDSIQTVILVGDYVVLYDERDEVHGSIVGLLGDSLVVGVSQDSVFNLALERVRSGVALEDFGDTWLDRMRRRWRHWSMGLSIGWEYEDGAVDTRKIDGSVHLEWRKGDKRLRADHVQKFEAKRPAEATEENTTKDEFRAFVLFENNLSTSNYFYAQPGAERDRPRGIELRAYPNAGLGHDFVDTERLRLQAGAGVAYVWEEFIGADDNEYLGLHLTGEYKWKTRLTLEISGRIMYIIGADEQWLFRSETHVDLPISELLALRFSLTDVADNNPTPDIGNNKITTNFALAMTFP